ncbi:hypothetical protein BU25DRAFT_478618 [Macroventuria anomochaeta]|uniref:Uncharacterized protein n=1 Tax=Macroventuria anomochaeta TaxID=301207 RepID=A0ACB6RNU0_9PLEO|nr:uncharacterized protein BU25DRAFT_478618 [Macroventuria anomochaeta]KAF2623065.1 hypothetical protein BU25DRAFT_478618 [Macroventuria anomochaeta]
MQDSVYFRDARHYMVCLHNVSVVQTEVERACWEGKEHCANTRGTHDLYTPLTVTLYVSLFIPSWTKGASIAVNGATQVITATQARTQTSHVLGSPATMVQAHSQRTLMLNLGSVKQMGTAGLSSKGTADSKSVNISPFNAAQGFNYVVYWVTSGSLPS